MTGVVRTWRPPVGLWGLGRAFWRRQGLHAPFYVFKWVSVGPSCWSVGFDVEGVCVSGRGSLVRGVG